MLARALSLGTGAYAAGLYDVASSRLRCCVALDAEVLGLRGLRRRAI